MRTKKGKYNTAELTARNVLNYLVIARCKMNIKKIEKAQKELCKIQERLFDAGYFRDSLPEMYGER